MSLKNFVRTFLEAFLSWKSSPTCTLSYLDLQSKHPCAEIPWVAALDWCSAKELNTEAAVSLAASNCDHRQFHSKHIYSIKWCVFLLEHLPRKWQTWEDLIDAMFLYRFHPEFCCFHQKNQNNNICIFGRMFWDCLLKSTV